jgi:phosphoribosylanthranilate isomerase
MAQHPEAQGFLLDAYTPGKPGGTGETFDWSSFPKNAQKPLILAGGLNSDNVKQSILQCTPYAVDVSGGVEASAGRKSKEKVIAFVRNAKQP